MSASATALWSPSPGVVDEIDAEKNKVTVVVSMFGRETPVELELDQVEVVTD